MEDTNMNNQRTDLRELKRLARRLNEESGTGTGNGFYAHYATFAVRCSRARIRKGVLEVHSLATETAWIKPSNNIFADVYGREIA